MAGWLGSLGSGYPIFHSKMLCVGQSLSTRLSSPLALITMQHRNYAKPVGGKKKGKFGMGPAVEKVRLPVETDSEKLVKFVCGSHPVKEDRQDVEIKDDSQYPDWLWTLRTGKAPPLMDLDPTTKYYWRRLRTEALRQKNLLSKVKKF